MNKADIVQCLKEPDTVIFTDASDFGFGGYIHGQLDSSLIGSWSLEESSKSSTWRELEAVHRYLLSHSECLEGRHILVNSDNKNVSRIFEYW